MTMNFSKLERHIVDTIEEQQLKLGYLPETVRLYYPLSSLNRFLAIDVTVEKMQECLQECCGYMADKLGEVKCSHQGERFCLAIPPEGARYVHEQISSDGFLAELIACVGTHGSTWGEVLSIFQKHSDSVHVQEMTNGEFNYLVYFEDGKPDDYRYCIADEGHHVTYHRYTPEDYEEFGF